MADDRDAAQADRGTGIYGWYVLGVLVIVYALSLLDRLIISILAEDIKRDLSLSDTQLGFLYGTAFAIFYTVFGIPLGRLADSWRRGWLLAFGMMFWSVMTMLSGAATSYTMLALARLGVGAGEASASPAAYSLLASTFPARRRALAIAIYSAGAYVGIGLSLPIGGWVAAHWDAAYAAGDAPGGLRGWQAAFIAVGAPGVLIAAWVLSLREPPRFDSAGNPRPVVATGVWRGFMGDLSAILPPFTLLAAARYPGELARNLAGATVIALVAALLIWLTGDTSQWAAFGLGCYAIYSWARSLWHSDRPAYRLIWGSPTVLLCVIGFGSVALIINTFGFWVAPYAMRAYGVSASEVGALIGIPGAIASALGSIFGGYLADRWKQRDPRGRIFVCMLAAGIPMPLILLMFTRPDLQSYLLISPLIYFFSSAYAGASVAAYQDFVLPRMYGTLGAVHLLGVTMIGLAIGPYGSGKIATITGSLQLGVFSILLGPAVALVALWLASRRAATTERDKHAWAVAAGEPTAGI